MAPRGTAAAAEEYDTERDLTPYLDKEPTAKMADYHEWLENVLGVKLDAQSVMLGVTLYPDFQRSEFNRGRTAARREARQAGNGTAEEAPATPARRGRQAAAKPAAAKGKAPAKPAGKSVKRGRTATTAAAPY